MVASSPTKVWLLPTLYKGGSNKKWSTEDVTPTYRFPGQATHAERSFVAPWFQQAGPKPWPTWEAGVQLSWLWTVTRKSPPISEKEIELQSGERARLK